MMAVKYSAAGAMYWVLWEEKPVVPDTFACHRFSESRSSSVSLNVEYASHLSLNSCEIELSWQKYSEKKGRLSALQRQVEWGTLGCSRRTVARACPLSDPNTHVARPLLPIVTLFPE